MRTTSVCGIATGQRIFPNRFFARKSSSLKSLTLLDLGTKFIWSSYGYINIPGTKDQQVQKQETHTYLFCSLDIFMWKYHRQITPTNPKPSSLFLLWTYSSSCNFYLAPRPESKSHLVFRFIFTSTYQLNFLRFLASILLTTTIPFLFFIYLFNKYASSPVLGIGDTIESNGDMVSALMEYII